MAKMTRAEVVTVLGGERNYQIDMARSDERPDMIPVLSVGETITAIDVILTEAKALWYKGNGDHPSAMHYLRKIGGLVIQAGENFGMPARKGYE